MTNEVCYTIHARMTGAMMDKLTYAELKGLGADVSKVTVLLKGKDYAK